MANNSTTRAKASKNIRSPTPQRRTKVTPRKKIAGRPKGSGSRRPTLSKKMATARENKENKRAGRSLKTLKKHALSLLKHSEVEKLARECGFYQRTPRAITAFDFALCCAMAAMIEGKRGFASVWRLLAAAAGVKVARSAVTQRFGDGSAQLMEELFFRAVKKLPKMQTPEMLDKLKRFQEVLAYDGSVVSLSPLMKKLFPATRTNSVAAAGKVHAIADLVSRRIVDVELTGERHSELDVVRTRPIKPGILYMGDLGYTHYEYFAAIKMAGSDLLWRLKDNANPKIVFVRHGIHAPVDVAKREYGLNDPRIKHTKCHDTFDLDARFETGAGPVVLRVIGRYNPETKKYHRYVTTLGAEEFNPNELASLYTLRWVIELLFKLLKSSCHLDHVDTSDPAALRTHLYASLLGATILSSLCYAAASVHGLHPTEISVLVAGIAAPILVMPLMFLWCRRKLSAEEMAATIFRVLAIGCRDQNPNRTKAKWGVLGF